MPLKSRVALIVVISCGLMSMTSCQDVDPLTRDRGDWKPAGVNQGNLEAQIVSPADLTAGVSDEGGDANQAAMAIDRLNSDKVKTIDHVGLVTIGGGSQ